MSESSIAAKSLEIRNETVDYANTKERVSNVIDDINATKANKVDIVSTNIYTSDGTLGGNRYVNLSTFYLYFSNPSNNAKIGINKNNPTESLDVLGRIKSDALVLNINTSSPIANQIRYDGTNLWLSNSTSIEKRLLFIDDLSKTVTSNFNPPTLAQLATLGINRGDYYVCVISGTERQRASYNGVQLTEWTMSTTEWNALSTDQKNAVKVFNITA